MSHQPETMSREFTSKIEVSEFINEAEKRFNEVLLHEPQVSEGAAVAITTREATIMGGPGGSGKTTLMKEMVKGIEGNNGNSLVRLQGLADTTPSQVVGAKVPTETYDGDGKLTETQIKRVKGLITPDTLFILADEWPRLPHETRESLLPVLAERVISSTEGEVEIQLPNLLGMIATQNFARYKDRTESVDARRFGAGLMFYMQDAETQDLISIQVADGIPADAAEPKAPFITVPKFQAVQNTVLYNRDSEGNALIEYGDNEKRHAVAYQRAIQGLVEELTGGETESTTNMSMQIGRLARAYVMKEQGKRIEDEHIVKAAKLVVAARVIMLDKTGDPVKQLREAHQTLESL